MEITPSAQLPAHFMPLVIAPTSATAPTNPAIGIFWRTNRTLVIDRSTLDQAAPYGDCLTHEAGHYQRWQQWQALGPAGLWLPCPDRLDRIRRLAARSSRLPKADAAFRAIC